MRMLERSLDYMTATPQQVDPAQRPPEPHRPPPGSGADGAAPSALAGFAGAAAALGASELVAGLVTDIPSLVVAIGNAVVEAGAGSRVKEVAIALFGTNEKTALIVGTVLLALLIGAGLGVLAARRGLGWGAGGFGAFALAGIAATAVNPLDRTALAVVPAAVAVVAGVATLRLMLRVNAAVAATGARGGDPARARRDFLRLGFGLTAIAAIAGVFGRQLSSRSQASAAREDVVLPEAATSAPPAPLADEFSEIDGLSPLYTPNEDFYRIDTALSTPMVDVDTWSVRIHGMVDNEVVLTYDDLLALPQFEADITIACVSNEVGGDLIGNARWQGVRLSDVLDLAGVDPTADQVVGRSVDGWTAGFPTQLAFDGRDSMIALAMNGEPLPIPHGFPARLIVPGVYGYVSATKWLSDIELTTWEAFDGYWIPRGWAKEGPVKTQSRIDVPARGQQLTAGPQYIAGMAWAQHRGVELVEVSIDDGPWEPAELGEEINPDTWRQWRLRWDATPGDHAIRVRATDRTGETQSATPVPVAPDGAEGHHTRQTRVV